MRDFWKGTLKFLAVVAVLLAIAGGILYAFFVKVVDIGHNGMAPTMILGDRVLVWKTQDIGLGDAVVCEHPEQPNRYVIGRVVGREGQTVSIVRGNLLISGETPDRDLRGTLTFDDEELGRQVQMQWGIENILDREHYVAWREGHRPEMGRPATISFGLYLMGDNRTHRGEDSRSFGPVAPGSCVGRIFMRLTASPSPPEIGNAPLDIIE